LNGRRRQRIYTDVRTNVRMMTACPSGLRMSDRESALTWLKKGRDHLTRGDCHLAIAAFTEAIRSTPEDPEAILLRGQAYQKEGKHEEALTDFTSALQFDTNETLHLAQEVLAAASRREFDTAATHADRSLRINQRLARTWSLRGSLYLEQGEWAKAESDYSRIVQLEPANGLAWLRRGEAHAGAGDQEKAISDFSEAIRLDGSNVAAWNLRGEALARLGQLDSAAADFSEALRLDPLSTAARNNRAALYFRQGNYQDAIADCTRAIEIDSHDPRAFLCRSLARTEKGDYERALDDLANALSRKPPRDSEDPEILERLRAAHDQVVASINRFKRNLRQAATRFTGAGILALPGREGPILAEIPYQQYPSSDHGDDHEQSPRAELYYERGWFFQQQENFDRAYEEYSAALTADPAFVDAYLERGQICRLAGRFEEAIADFTAAIERDGANTEARLRRANTWTEWGHCDEAFEDYAEALRIDPNLTAAYVNRCVTWLKIGDYQQAALDAEKALRIEPGHPKALFLHGVACGKLSRYDEAAADFDRLLQLEPEHAPAHNQRGLIHAAQEKYAEAVAAYTEARRLQPEFDPALFNRGTAYGAWGRPEDALADFTEFLRRRPDHAPGYHHRGLVHLEKGEYDQAIADFSRAIELDPTLHKAYVSCLEAMRVKYREDLARQKEAREQVGSAETVVSLVPDTINEARPSLEKNKEEEPLLLVEDVAGSAGNATETVPSSGNPEKDTVYQRIEDSALVTRIEDGSPRRTFPPAPATPEVPATQPKPAIRSAKLRLECPGCGTMGLFDLRNLGKQFRCPSCSSWWRTNAAGQLVQAPAPPTEAKAPDPARTSPQPAVTAKAPAVEKQKPDKPPAPPAPAKPAPPPKAGKPRPKTSAEESRLRDLMGWMLSSAKTKSGVGVMAAGVLGLLFLMPVLFPSLFPSKLKKRGTQAVHAWLSKDIEQIKPFVEPSLTGQVPRWLEEAPPPDLAGQEPPRVSVAVQRNDGRTADLLVQIKAKKKDGAPAFFVFRHRWVHKDGVWYVRPGISTTGVTAAGS
jgi:tetratricopeptide (TPR) repeat protein